MGKQMVLLNEINSFSIQGSIVKMNGRIIQFYEFKDCFVVRLDELNDLKESKALRAYHYADRNFQVKWEFPYNYIIGMSPIIPELKKVVDFYMPEIYYEFMNKYKGKELLQVFAGEFQFIIDANTGEIYEKMDSR